MVMDRKIAWTRIRNYTKSKVMALCLQGRIALRQACRTVDGVYGSAQQVSEHALTGRRKRTSEPPQALAVSWIPILQGILTENQIYSWSKSGKKMIDSEMQFKKPNLHKMAETFCPNSCELRKIDICFLQDIC